MRPVNRITPNLPVGAFKTYEIRIPQETHFRPGTCEEAECSMYLNGWLSKIDESTELGQKQAHYIRKQSGRKFTETRNEVGLTEFTFEPGQSCFSQHKVRLDKPELYVVRDGDWRGSRGIIRKHSRASDWVEDFQENQQRLIDER